MMASFFSLVWSFRTLHLVHVASHLTAVPIFFHIIVMMTGDDNDYDARCQRLFLLRVCSYAYFL